ncbi:hypothetical protein ILUMI_13650 [Ignelater luminosus]|uniref:Aldehyde dehydrogenase n=1 Tax=Ignelater luminosus TaxID=2038154 RepID=A0A8K0CY43_IGNLU|nr:hypothetical protein ILUMI_13650 [Ignelater luminosus]
MAKVESELILPSTKVSSADYTNAAVIDIEPSESLPVPKCNGNFYKRNASDVVAIARAAFRSYKTKSVEFRRQQLKNLLRMFDENAKDMEDALKKDLGRHRQEASTLDVEYGRNEILKALMHLDEWTKPETPSKPLVNTLDKIRIYSDPYGVVLIISSWNFPINLVFTPLAGAIAGGNCVIIKPSELAEATAQLIAGLVPKYLDKECYQVYLGDATETAELLKERFDYIFFTGSTTVARIVHAAANKYLTPVTLELGGKSPVFIDKSADMEISVRRILWGKCSNAGQVCIAPDYILCTKEVQENFVSIATKVLKEWYGDDAQSSPDYCRIISDRHYNRLMNFLKDKRNIVIGGKSDAASRFIEPTILVDVNPNDPIMQEEVFGPILPIVTIENPYEAINFINAREKPLVIYVFTKKKATKDLFASNTSSGGLSINETLFHFSVDTLPFGGVGFSGMGAYHGKNSFDTFVHKKGTFDRDFATVTEKSTSFRYPPYSEIKTSFINGVMRPRKAIVPYKYIKPFLIFCLGIIFVIIVQLIYCHVSDKHFF